MDLIYHQTHNPKFMVWQAVWEVHHRMVYIKFTKGSSKTLQFSVSNLSIYVYANSQTL